MKTSTPVNEALRKKKRSFISKDKSLISIEENEGSLQSEIQNRRLEAINKSSEVRRSTAAPLLDVQHYKDCIKLSAENKINSKNAFSLLLIDLMAAMTKKKDSEINQNFQVASCTLDASVKIYGYRVDAVHMDVMKMAGGFNTKGAQKDEDDAEENPNLSPDEDGNDLKLKVKKKKKKLTVVKPETLNVKNESDILLDMVPRQNLFALKTDGNDLLIKIPKFNDSSTFIIDPDFPMWPFDGNELLVPQIEKEKTSNIYELMQGLSGCLLTDGESICEFYNNFEFGKNYDEEVLNSDNEMDISREGTHFEFDLNASVHDDINADGDNTVLTENLTQNIGSKLHVPLGGYDSGEEISMPDPHLPQKACPAKIVDMKKRISRNHLEYSLFDEIVFKSWAGPTFWKIKPFLNKKSLESDKENEEALKPVTTKRTRKGKSLPSVGLFDVSFDALTKYLASGDRSTLTKQTMLNWNHNNTTTPKDCKYKSKSLFTLYHIPTIVIQPRVSNNEIDDSLGKTETELNDNDENNHEELEYCSNLTINDGVEAEDCDANYNVADGIGDVIDHWDVDNMVAVPNKVGKIVVSSFKRSKHIDIKHLKKSIWNILLNPEKDKTCSDPNSKMTATISFRDLLKKYPQRLPSSLVSILSAPLIFNALLHLTNEKCLKLKQEKERKKIDFDISQ